MEAKVQELPEMTVAAVRHVGPYNECTAAWQALVGWAGPNGLLGPDTQFWSVSYDDPEVTPPSEIRMDVCVTAPAGTQTAPPVELKIIGGGRYAFTLHKGPYERLHEVYKALCGQWIPEQGLIIRDAPAMEQYLNNPECTPADELLTEVYMPVE